MTEATLPLYRRYLVVYLRGDPRGKALRNIGEAIQLYLEDLTAAGEAIPVEDGREYVEVRC
jgi:predicted RNase H-like HicB family nuclease